MLQATTACAELRAQLRRGRHRDGGWGYYAGKAPRLEPTACAALALEAGNREAVDCLGRWPHRNGLLLERPDGDANYGFHGLALLALSACHATHTLGIAALVASIDQVKGVRLDASDPRSGQDNRLQAWSWIPNTFSWVEPTAWCMLSLKKAAASAGAAIDSGRLDEAERLLINRCCRSGGWNYGNADVLGKDLFPYVPTTAIALLALQDRRHLDVVGRSLDYLEANATAERSATALALTAIALRVYGRSADDARAALMAQLATTVALGNHVALALAAYVLDPDQTYAAFTL